MVFGISMVVASFALGGVISADYCRFAKSRGDVVKSSIVGVIPAGLFMLLTGALMSIVTGQYDISAILAVSGRAVRRPGRARAGHLDDQRHERLFRRPGALSNLLGFDESKFKITTGIAGAIGTLAGSLRPAERVPGLPRP